jgi:flavin-dependent thymidylate synthase
MSEPSKEIARFADVAMFKAEPIDIQAGPQVHLLWMTPDPLGAIAAACKMYKGEVVRDLATVTDAERLEYLEQITKTKLKAPFEFVKFHFLIEGVTRSFTHQLVRQRTAVYAQESLRFAVKEDMPVALPPSIPADDPDSDKIAGTTAIWYDAIEHIQSAYNHLINSGIPAEDARGLLPHNVLTRVHYSTDLRALLDHAGNRLCTQAQFEWRIVFSKIAKAIRGLDDVNARAIGGPVHDGIIYAKMASHLADLFAPVCYQTGKCEFRANFDRHCSIRDRVDNLGAKGIPSSQWGDKRSVGDNVIMPSEWLLNHASARKRS